MNFFFVMHVEILQMGQIQDFDRTSDVGNFNFVNSPKQKIRRSYKSSYLILQGAILERISNPQYMETNDQSNIPKKSVSTYEQAFYSNIELDKTGTS